MEWQHNFIEFPLLISAFIAFQSAFILGYFLERRLIKTLSLLLAAAGIWALFYAFEIWTAEPSLQVLFKKLEYAGICFIPPLWFHFCLQFSSLQKTKTKKSFSALIYFLPSILTWIIVLTNDLHHWFWVDSTRVSFGNSRILSNTNGFWFWGFALLSYTLIAAGLLIVILKPESQKRNPFLKIMVAVGVMLPVLSSILFILKVYGPFEWTPFALTVSGLLLAIGIYRFNLFNLKPLTKTALLSTLNSPVIFINREHVIVEANRAAEQLFAFSSSAFMNEKIETLFETKTDFIPLFDLENPFEISFRDGQQQVFYQVMAEPVIERHKPAGYLLTLCDITADRHEGMAAKEQVSEVAFINEINALGVNSSDIKDLLDRTIKIFSNPGWTDGAFLVLENGDPLLRNTPADQHAVSLASMDIGEVSHVVNQARTQKIMQIIEDSGHLKNIFPKNWKNKRLVACPLYSNRGYLGSLVLIGNSEFSPARHCNLIEQSINNLMVSVSRLQLLEELENKVIERTDQVVKLNTDLENNYFYLDRIVDTSPNLVFCLDNHERIILCNTKFLTEFGFSEKEAVVDKPLGFAFNGRDQKLLERITAINQNGNPNGQFECSMTLKPGSQKIFLLNKSIVFPHDHARQEFIYILIDLTRQKNQETKIRNSEQRLLSLFESVPVILFEEDHSELKNYINSLKKEHGDNAINFIQARPETLPEIGQLIKITDCNQMALDFYGFSTKEELIKGYTKLISKTAAGTFKLEVENFLLGKTEFETETIHLRTSGEKAYLKMRLHIPPENHHDFRRVLVSIVDITKRKQAEIDLISSEEKFRSVIQQSVDGIILFDHQGKIIEWNNADEKITGYSPADIAEMTIDEVFSKIVKNTTNLEPSSKEGIRQYHTFLQGQVSPQSDTMREFEITTRSGQKAMIAATSFVINIGQDFISAISMRDITQFKKSQAEVQKLASAAHEISEGLVIANSAGETEYVNRAVEKITGYSRSELLGKNLLLALGKETPLEQLKDIQSKLELGKIQRGKLISQKKDGTFYTLQYNIAPNVDDQGNQNFISVISDVSQSELKEQQNRQAQKLEAIGSLAAGVAHEINTPTQYVGNNLLFIKNGFTAITQVMQKNTLLWQEAMSGGRIEQLVDKLQKEEKMADIEYLNHEIPQAINESLEGISRVTKIVQAIKEFSHPNIDEKAPVDLNQAIDTTITVSRNEWKYVADLVPHLDPILPTVICSPGEINQVILNLITNAAHAIKEQITKGIYKKGLIEISTKSGENGVEIRVKDNGAGIPAAYQEKVFDPFFTTKPVGMGTGQGLSIAHKVIVDKHNGSLGFETEIGSGTTFIITLPWGLVEKNNPQLLDGQDLGNSA